MEGGAWGRGSGGTGERGTGRRNPGLGRSTGSAWGPGAGRGGVRPFRSGETGPGALAFAFSPLWRRRRRRKGKAPVRCGVLPSSSRAGRGARLRRERVAADPSQAGPSRDLRRRGRRGSVVRDEGQGSRPRPGVGPGARWGGGRGGGGRRTGRSQGPQAGVDRFAIGPDTAQTSRAGLHRNARVSYPRLVVCRAPPQSPRRRDGPRPPSFGRLLCVHGTQALAPRRSREVGGRRARESAGAGEWYVEGRFFPGVRTVPALGAGVPVSSDLPLSSQFGVPMSGPFTLFTVLHSQSIVA